MTEQNRRNQLLALICLLFVIASPAYSNNVPKKVNCGPGSLRLPTSLRPLHYSLHLKPDIDAKTSLGTVDISLINQANTSTERITLQSLLARSRKESTSKSTVIVLNVDREYVKINDDAIRFTRENGHEVKIGQVCYDDETETISITLKEAIDERSKGRLHLEFTGVIRDDDSKGFYLSEAKDELTGQSRSYLATVLNPADARSMFPCFDEPSFKATFELTLSHPADKMAIFNTKVLSSVLDKTDESSMVTKFAKTPLMSPYMLGLVIGQFDHVEKTARNGQVKIRVYTKPGRSEDGSLVLEKMCSLLEFFEQKLGLEYPLDKLDFVSVPKFGLAALESFGLITVGENLLYIDDETSLYDVQSSLLTISHSIANQWFGNIVTMDWWDELCLNEGLAHWFSVLAVDELFPEYEIGLNEKRLMSSIRPTDLENKRMRPEQLTSKPKLSELLDEDSYHKFGSVIGLMHNYVGADKFMSAIREYLQKHQFGNVKTNDLVVVMEKHSGLTLGKFVNSWLDLTGHPLLVVDYEQARNALEITLREYYIPDRSDLWVIPSSMIVSDGAARFEEVRFVLDSAVNRVQLPKWFNPKKKGHFVKLNPNYVGLYTVDYPEELCPGLLNAIRNKNLGLIDRLDILKASTRLYRGGAIKLGNLALLYRVLYQSDNDSILAAEMLTEADATLLYREGLNAAKKIYRKLGGLVEEEGAGFSHMIANSEVFSSMASQGYKPAINEALMLFDNSLGHIPASLRNAVYETVAMKGSDKQFNSLHEFAKHIKSSSHSFDAINSLGRTKNAKRLETLIEWLQNSDFIGKSDVLERLSSINDEEM